MEVCRECRKVQPIANLPYCKDCLTNIYQKYYNTMNKGKHFALWCVCAELNIPYFNHIAKSHSVTDVISYIKILYTTEKFSGFCDTHEHLYDIVSMGKLAKTYNESVDRRLDKEKEEHGEEIAGLVTEQDKEKAKLKKKIESLEAETRKLKEKLKYATELLEVGEGDITDMSQHAKDLKNWGEGYSPEEYKMLNEIYELYTCEIENVTPAMQFRYQDLSKLEMRRRQLGSNADPKESKTVADELKALYAMLGIGEFDKATKSDDEKFVDRITWMIENTTPAEVEDINAYCDISGFQEAWDEIMRCLSNAVGVTNEFPELKESQDGDD